MMKLNGEALQEKAWGKIEAATAQQLATWHDALAQIADPHTRGELENAAIGLAGAWADAALWLGWQMRADPGKWLFVDGESSAGD